MGSIKSKTLKIIITYTMLIIGTIIAAAALECFLIPNTILDGGVTGISIIIYKLFGIPLWLLVIIINIPFIYIGYKNLGKNFLLRTGISMLSFAFFLSFFELVKPFKLDIAESKRFDDCPDPTYIEPEVPISEIFILPPCVA